MRHDLPFVIGIQLADLRGNVRFTASMDGKETAIATYKPGDDVRRNAVARKWAADHRLRNGTPLAVADVAAALEAQELIAIPQVEAFMSRDSESNDQQQPVIEAASVVAPTLLGELAWNAQQAKPDFIVYDRETRSAARADSVKIGDQTYITPTICTGIVTAGYPQAGNVLLPTTCDETGTDEDRLRDDLLTFIDRYVELPHGMNLVVVEYVLFSWVFDGFDELPYLAFRTADAGRGKSRAIETIGALCNRATFCGGGSTAAATLRLIDVFGGTLVADEMDLRDSEMAAELTKILNQGFQRGRPLVRCVGDASTPKPFRCFGPKIFALRKGFADDATETRIVSVLMRQRTRRDIPLNLPREQFDREAAALRNRLLAWRFANLGAHRIAPWHADPRLEDRLNQIGLPLLAIARDADARHRIVEALLGQQADVAADRGDSLAGEVLRAALAIGITGQTIRPADVASEVNRRRAAAAGVEPDRLGAAAIRAYKVGYILKGDLELPRHRDREGTSYLLDADRLALLAKRYGIPTGEVATLATLPQNGLGDTENADFSVATLCDSTDGNLPQDEDGGGQPLQPDDGCHSNLPQKNRVLDSENGDCGNCGNCGRLSGTVDAVSDIPPHGWTTDAWQAACGLDGQQDTGPADDVVIL